MLLVFPVVSSANEFHGLVIVQKFIKRYTFIRQQEPHPSVSPQTKRYCSELIGPIVLHGIALMHKVAFHRFVVCAEKMELPLFRSVLGKLRAPLGSVIDGGGQCHDNLGIHGKTGCLFFQKSAGLCIDPAAQCFVICFAAHFTTERRCPIILSQVFHGGLGILHAVIKPYGVCKNAGHGTIVTVMGIPDRIGLCPQVFNTVDPQQVQNLLTALAIRNFRQHGKGHIDVDGRINLIRTIRAAQKLPDTAVKENLQTIGVALRLIPLSISVLSPRFIDLVESFVIKFTGLLVHELHLIGIVRHFRVCGQCQSIRLQLGIVGRRIITVCGVCTPCHRA